ncbi:uncharacterized protein [Coffea arabica]|uniref:RNase H type-1 domain-containing protein n=1 Tax=Coffea arabica TaxID=13443 RepID=A0ABM4W8U0_COFAR
MRIAQGARRLSYLIFANDSLIFCKASVEEAGQVRRILDVYKQASGQLINVEKSSLFFSRNMSNRQREGVMRELQGIKRSKRQVFDFIRQKTIARLKGWKQKLLSQAGKEVLLKSVIMALPTYVMSCCLLPKIFQGNIHLEDKSSGADSWCWKSLLKAKKLLGEGIRKQIGDGKSINIWEDKWLPETEDGKVKTRNVEGIEVQRVSKLIKDGIWDKELIAQAYKNRFWHWWEELKEAVNKENGRERIVLTVNLLWQIWKSRNKRQFTDKGRDLMVAANKAVMEWREYQEAQEAEMEIGGYSKSVEEASNGWKRPKKSWVRINSDAALYQKMDKVGWGMVARDWQWKVLGAWAVPNSSYSNPKLEEAMVLRAAMLVAKQQGWRSVESETDCLQVVNGINREEDDVIRSVVVFDIRKLKSNFDECCFTFTRRVNNFVSHKLANGNYLEGIC